MTRNWCAFTRVRSHNSGVYMYGLTVLVLMSLFRLAVGMHAGATAQPCDLSSDATASSVENNLDGSGSQLSMTADQENQFREAFNNLTTRTVSNKTLADDFLTGLCLNQTIRRRLSKRIQPPFISSGTDWSCECKS